jgi:ActR/RegA family two-component response regulator
MRYATSHGVDASSARSRSLVVCEPSDASPALVRRRVLIVDDDVAALEMWALLLAEEGVLVEVAPSAAACLRLMATRDFDLLVVDLRLGEDSGLELVRQLQSRGTSQPFVLVTGHANVAVTVDAMRLGARTVLEKPLVGDDFVAPILRALRELEAEALGRLAAPAYSIADRWARHVLAASSTSSDPRTLAAWARAAGVSRSALIEVCARLDVNPRDARDLARVLRLVRRADIAWDPEASLDVADRRTLHRLLVRAGLAATPRGSRPAPQQFLARQRFVPQTNAGLAMLRLMVG